MVIYRIILALVAVIDIFICVRVWNRKPAGRTLGKALIAGTVTSVGYLLSVCTENMLLSSIFSSMYFCGIDVMLIYLLWYMVQLADYQLTGVHAWLPHMYRAVIAADCISLALNPVFEHAVDFYPMDVAGFTIYKYIPYWPFNLHLGLCYLILVMMTAFTVYIASKTPLMYRGRYISILAIIGIVVVLNVFYLIGAKYFAIDISVCFYSLAAGLIFLSVYKIIPARLTEEARAYVMEAVRWPTVMFDYEEHLIYANAPAGELFPTLADRAQIGQLRLWEFVADNEMPVSLGDSSNFEWKHRVKGRDVIYNCETQKIKDSHGDTIGYILVMRNTASSIDEVTGLDKSDKLIEKLKELSSPENYPIQLLSIKLEGAQTIDRLFGRDISSRMIGTVVKLMKRIMGKDVYLAIEDRGAVVAVMPNAHEQEVEAYGRDIKELCFTEKCSALPIRVRYAHEEINQNHRDVYVTLAKMWASLGLWKNDLPEEATYLVETILRNAESHDKGEYARIEKYARKLAEYVGMSDDELDKLLFLCKYHDMSNLEGIEEPMYNPEKASLEEKQQKAYHVLAGYRILAGSEHYRKYAIPLLHHHEMWNGGGFPGGVIGEEIDFAARAFYVIHVYDVLTSRDNGEPLLEKEVAIQRMIEKSGSWFDPIIVGVFADVVEQL